MAYHPQPPNPISNDDHRPSNRRLYNPYQDLNFPTKTIYNLPTSLEFLFQEESLTLRRSWGGGGNITYYTGIGYLAGAAKCFVSGVKAIEPTDTTKLKINRILNGSGHAGRQIGNRCGVVAGLGTGGIYKAAAGPRSAAVAGAIGGMAVGLAVTGKQTLKRYAI